MFLRSLLARGFTGVQLVISDAREGLKAAVATVLATTSWQRCRVHFMRNALSYVPKMAQPVVSAAIRTAIAQPDLTSARNQLQTVAAGLEEYYPRVAALRQIYSTNPLERLNKEIKRHSDADGIFPNLHHLLRHNH